MVFQSKYLKEIGIDENYWLFKNTHYIPNKNDFVRKEFFNLDITFALMIYSHLCYFKENIATISIPSFCFYNKNGDKLNQKQAEFRWNQILSSMIEAFKIKIISQDMLIKYFNTNDYTEIEKKKYKIWRKGSKLFIDYFDALWY